MAARFLVKRSGRSHGVLFARACFSSNACARSRVSRLCMSRVPHISMSGDSAASCCRFFFIFVAQRRV
ncbi:hypothetical protein BDQ17DRAFT_1343556 [Cyathus striatus]|nr:hypothetical protein BDQ17DRAFT_1343556 [Cyathus striatus]